MSVQLVNGSVYTINALFHGLSEVLGTYVVKGESTMIVDPGTTISISNIEKGLKEIGVLNGHLKWVAATHIHLDHTGGSWKFLEDFPIALLYVHPRGSRHMIDPRRLEEAARGLFGDTVEAYGDIKGGSS